MSLRQTTKNAVWIAAGALFLLAIILMVAHSQKQQAHQLAAKAQRIQLVNQIGMNLASSVEAEKSAVMAPTETSSRMFAERARAAAASVEKARLELEKLLKSNEREPFSQFSQSFAELQHIDKEVLDLAVKNTNLKASALAFGPAVATAKELDAALARLPLSDAKTVRVADDARIAVWRLLALLPPHIAEESEQKMDTLEAEMTEAGRQVRRSLDTLVALTNLSNNADLKAIVTSYARFEDIRAEILKLSRENTNVRSLSLSLTQKRNATSWCLTALNTLHQVIQNEPVGNVTTEEPTRPR